MKYYTYRDDFTLRGFINSDVVVANATTVEPLPNQEGFINQFDTDTQTWSLIDVVGDLSELKEEKILELSAACESTILSGIDSSVLGTQHSYQTERDDQNNLVALVALGLDDYFKCFDGSVWSYKLHTIAQLRQLLIEGAAMKMTNLTNYNTKKQLVLDATTSNEIKNIVW